MMYRLNLIEDGIYRIYLEILYLMYNLRAILILIISWNVYQFVTLLSFEIMHLRS